MEKILHKNVYIKWHSQGHIFVGQKGCGQDEGSQKGRGARRVTMDIIRGRVL